METIATLFSGGEGVGIGAKAAGVRHIWGIEKHDDIAQVARDNGFEVKTADVLDVDPHTLEVPHILHASPECKSASVANVNRGETRLDITLGERIAHFIDVLRPRVFTLENVYQYRNFVGFKRVMAALARNDYMYHFSNLNAADFGLPQTRKRLILRAIRGSLLPNLPPPGQWIGWYEAIEDLIPTLPESPFPPWQKSLLPEWATETMLFHNNRSHDRNGVAYNKLSSRATHEPGFTVTTRLVGQVRAFIVDGQQTRGGRHLTTRRAGEPINTIHAQPLTKQPRRAWLDDGRTVKMTLQTITRWQTFPDHYKLPENNRLASRIIGNSVPPLLYQRITELWS